MRLAPFFPSADMAWRNSRVPERAMVPRFSSRSFSSMPMPESDTVRVFLSFPSKEISMRGAKGLPRNSSCVRVRYFILSRASDALETSSRRKISGCEYREWMMRCSSWPTSVWNWCRDMERGLLGDDPGRPCRATTLRKMYFRGSDESNGKL